MFGRVRLLETRDYYQSYIDSGFPRFRRQDFNELLASVALISQGRLTGGRRET